MAQRIAVFHSPIEGNGMLTQFHGDRADYRVEGGRSAS
jgi:hypothetical protein